MNVMKVAQLNIISLNLELSGRGICKKLVNEVVYMMKLMMKNSDFHTGNVVSIELYRPVA